MDSLSSSAEGSGLIDPMFGCVARCEQCEVGYELDGVELWSEGELAGDCPDCGGPLYLVGPDDVAAEELPIVEPSEVYVSAWMDGWNACHEAQRAFVKKHGDRLGDALAVFEAAVEAAR